MKFLTDMNSRSTCSVRRIALALLLVFKVSTAQAEDTFAGIVSSATPEATAAGVGILERGGNAIDAAIAVSLALGATEPAGSGLFGQTVMLVRLAPNTDPFVIHGTTYSPGTLPSDVERGQLTRGHTASTIPSTLRVLDFAKRNYGSSAVSWADVLAPAIHYASEGFVVGPFRHRAFRNEMSELAEQKAARELFVRSDGIPYQIGDVFKNPKLATTLRRVAADGALDFYRGKIAAEIVADMESNSGWITAEDLSRMPEPEIVPALHSSYRGHDIYTLPPPFGGWVVLQILNILEKSPVSAVDADDDSRRLALLDAMSIAHNTRRYDPVPGFHDYATDIATKISREEAQHLLDAYMQDNGGETTHFSIVDADGMVVSATQSIDSYFGSHVAHPTLGFLYNNYMQSFRLEDDGSPYVLAPWQMPLSSMSATILSRNGQTELVLGSPGSARIISAVAQVTNHWVDIGAGVEAAVNAYRVHAVPDKLAYVEGDSISSTLLLGLAKRGFALRRPAYGVSDSQLDPYFGGVHALARQNDVWTGAADPRRDGTVGIAYRDKND